MKHVISFLNTMMLILILSGGLLLASTVHSVLSISSTTEQKTAREEEIIIPTADLPTVGMYINFKKPVPEDLFYVADGYKNGGTFNCLWDKEMSSLYNSKLTLRLESIESKWHCAEYATTVLFHYGLYEASLKAPSQHGVVTFFGTFAANGDEIDMEFNGSKPGEVELNYWSRGRITAHTIIQLGFDVSEGYHTYAFDWKPIGIDWYIDKKLVWTNVFANYGAKVDTPSPIVMNIWAANKSLGDGWLGGYLDAANPPRKNIEASFEWIRFTPFKSE